MMIPQKGKCQARGSDLSLQETHMYFLHLIGWGPTSHTCSGSILILAFVISPWRIGNEASNHSLPVLKTNKSYVFHHFHVEYILQQHSEFTLECKFKDNSLFLLRLDLFKSRETRRFCNSISDHLIMLSTANASYRSVRHSIQ